MARITVEDKEARLGMKRRFDRAEDFRPVLRWARQELEEANRANFTSQGSTSGKPWLPLDDEYGRWKLANYGPLPILIVSGSLKESLVRLRGRPNEIGKKSAVFGTNIPYAKFHQYGKSKMPQRKIVFVPTMFAKGLASQIAEYIVHGRFGNIPNFTLFKRGF